ncbi:hypothetical protein Cgig2_003866 [Carnegiea gigantea]|uniref:Reverse transcriptase zinc-binding domain-containing protein n=1 Tax=Carnegiea gigantea TaxID=171969 RepID=A0A9Q1K3N9_9CARY|nr:hypothetical protein Cgig2_003866 [Carnegiea gigantea]
MPLCASSPQDKLIWHYQSQGSFTDRSTDHMLIDDMHSATRSASMHENGLSRAVWCCNVPSRIKVFGWRAATGALPSTAAIASHISMACSICRHIEEPDGHATLECPLAVQIRQGRELDTSLWEEKYRSLADCLDYARCNLDDNLFASGDMQEIDPQPEPPSH